jgi:SAM-dependent methyltransferase
MTHAFQASYSAYYDLLYRDKDYAGEAAFVAGLLRRQFAGVAHPRVLDVACGTGRHLVELARLGFRMHGCDQSAEMLARAKALITAAGVSAELHHVPFEGVGTVPHRFDSVTSLFASMNYLTTYRDLAQTLDGMRRVLEPGGVLLFDVWNGNAVLDHYSPVRVHEVRDGTRRLLRTGETSLDRLRHIARVRYHIVLTDGDRVTSEFVEDHVVRYFFPQEMTDLLGIHGFDVVQLCPFLQPDHPLGPLDWNMTYVARARRSA